MQSPQEAFPQVFLKNGSLSKSAKRCSVLTAGEITRHQEVLRHQETSERKWGSLLLTPPPLSCIACLSHSFRSGHCVHWECYAKWPKEVSPCIWGRLSSQISPATSAHPTHFPTEFLGDLESGPMGLTLAIAGVWFYMKVLQALQVTWFLGWGSLGSQEPCFLLLPCHAIPFTHHHWQRCLFTTAEDHKGSLMLGHVTRSLETAASMDSTLLQPSPYCPALSCFYRNFLIYLWLEEK